LFIGSISAVGNFAFSNLRGMADDRSGYWTNASWLENAGLRLAEGFSRGKWLGGFLGAIGLTPGTLISMAHQGWGNLGTGWLGISNHILVPAKWLVAAIGAHASYSKVIYGKVNWVESILYGVEVMILATTARAIAAGAGGLLEGVSEAEIIGTAEAPWRGIVIAAKSLFSGHIAAPAMMAQNMFQTANVLLKFDLVGKAFVVRVAESLRRRWGNEAAEKSFWYRMISGFGEGEPLQSWTTGIWFGSYFYFLRAPMKAAEAAASNFVKQTGGFSNILSTAWKHLTGGPIRETIWQTIKEAYLEGSVADLLRSVGIPSQIAEIIVEFIPGDAGGGATGMSAVIDWARLEQLAASLPKIARTEAISVGNMKLLGLELSIQGAQKAAKAVNETYASRGESKTVTQENVLNLTLDQYSALTTSGMLHGEANLASLIALGKGSLTIKDVARMKGYKDSHVFASEVLGIQLRPTLVSKKQLLPGFGHAIGIPIQGLDFNIGADGTFMMSREAHNVRNEGYKAVLSMVAVELGIEADSKGKYDFRGAITNDIARGGNGIIKTSHGEISINEDGRLIIIDSRMPSGHAGRNERACYARDAAEAVHEDAELAGWENFAIEEGIATQEQIEAGELSDLLQDYINGEGELKTIAEKAEELHQAAVEAEAEFIVEHMQGIRLHRMELNRGGITMELTAKLQQLLNERVGKETELNILKLKDKNIIELQYGADSRVGPKVYKGRQTIAAHTHNHTPLPSPLDVRTSRNSKLDGTTCYIVMPRVGRVEFRTTVPATSCWSVAFPGQTLPVSSGQKASYDSQAYGLIRSEAMTAAHAGEFNTEADWQQWFTEHTDEIKACGVELTFTPASQLSADVLAESATPGEQAEQQVSLEHSRDLDIFISSDGSQRSKDSERPEVSVEPTSVKRPEEGEKPDDEDKISEQEKTKEPIITIAPEHRGMMFERMCFDITAEEVRALIKDSAFNTMTVGEACLRLGTTLSEVAQKMGHCEVLPDKGIGYKDKLHDICCTLGIEDPKKLVERIEQGAGEVIDELAEQLESEGYQEQAEYLRCNKGRIIKSIAAKMRKKDFKEINLDATLGDILGDVIHDAFTRTVVTVVETVVFEYEETIKDRTLRNLVASKIADKLGTNLREDVTVHIDVEGNVDVIDSLYTDPEPFPLSGENQNGGVKRLNQMLNSVMHNPNATLTVIIEGDSGDVQEDSGDVQDGSGKETRTITADSTVSNVSITTSDGKVSVAISVAQTESTQTIVQQRVTDKNEKTTVVIHETIETSDGRTYHVLGECLHRIDGNIHYTYTPVYVEENGQQTLKEWQVTKRTYDVNEKSYQVEYDEQTQEVSKVTTEDGQELSGEEMQEHNDILKQLRGKKSHTEKAEDGRSSVKYKVTETDKDGRPMSYTKTGRSWTTKDIKTILAKEGRTLEQAIQEELYIKEKIELHKGQRVRVIQQKRVIPWLRPKEEEKDSLEDVVNDQIALCELFHTDHKGHADHATAMTVEKIHQSAAIHQLMSTHNTFFEIPTGTGKTFYIFMICAMVAKQQGIKMVFITHNEEQHEKESKETNERNELFDKIGIEKFNFNQEKMRALFGDDAAMRAKVLSELEAADVVYMTANSFMFFDLAVRNAQLAGHVSAGYASAIWDTVFKGTKIIHDEADTAFFRNRVQTGKDPKPLTDTEKRVQRMLHHAFFRDYLYVKYKDKDGMTHEGRLIDIEDPLKRHEAELSLLRASATVEMDESDGKKRRDIKEISYTEYLAAMESGKKVSVKIGDKDYNAKVIQLNDVHYDEKVVMAQYEEWCKLMHIDENLELKHEYDMCISARRNALIQLDGPNIGLNDYYDENNPQWYLMIKPAPAGVVTPELQLSDPYFAGNTELLFSEYKKAEIKKYVETEATPDSEAKDPVKAQKEAEAKNATRAELKQRLEAREELEETIRDKGVRTSSGEIKKDNAEVIQGQVEQEGVAKQARDTLELLELTNWASVTTMQSAVRRARNVGADFSGFTGTLKGVEQFTQLFYGLSVARGAYRAGEQTSEAAQREEEYFYNRISSLQAIKDVDPALDKIFAEIDSNPLMLHPIFYNGLGFKDEEIMKDPIIKKLLAKGPKSYVIFVKKQGTGWLRLEAGKDPVDTNINEVKDYLSKGNNAQQRVAFYFNTSATRATDPKYAHAVEEFKSVVGKAHIRQCEVDGERVEAVDVALLSKEEAEAVITEARKRLKGYAFIDRNTPEWLFIQLAGRDRGIMLLNPATGKYDFISRTAEGDLEFGADNKVYHELDTYIIGSSVLSDRYNKEGIIENRDGEEEKREAIQKELKGMFEVANQRAIQLAIYSNLTDKLDSVYAEFFEMLMHNASDEERKQLYGYIDAFQNERKRDDSLKLRMTAATTQETLNNKVRRMREKLRQITESDKFERLNPHIQQQILAEANVQEKAPIHLSLRIPEGERGHGEIAFTNTITGLVNAINANITEDMLPKTPPQSSAAQEAAYTARADEALHSVEKEQEREKIEAGLTTSGHIDKDGRISESGARLVSYCAKALHTANAAIMTAILEAFRGGDDDEAKVALIFELVERGVLSLGMDNFKEVLNNTLNSVAVLANNKIIEAVTLDEIEQAFKSPDRDALIKLMLLKDTGGLLDFLREHMIGTEKFRSRILKAQAKRQHRMLYREEKIEPWWTLPRRFFGIFPAALTVSLLVKPFILPSSFVGNALASLVIPAYILIGGTLVPQLSVAATQIGRGISIWGPSRSVKRAKKKITGLDKDFMQALAEGHFAQDEDEKKEEEIKKALFSLCFISHGRAEFTRALNPGITEETFERYNVAVALEADATLDEVEFVLSKGCELVVNDEEARLYQTSDELVEAVNKDGFSADANTKKKMTAMLRRHRVVKERQEAIKTSEELKGKGPDSKGHLRKYMVKAMQWLMNNLMYLKIKHIGSVTLVERVKAAASLAILITAVGLIVVQIALGFAGFGIVGVAVGAGIVMAAVIGAAVIASVILHAFYWVYAKATGKESAASNKLYVFYAKTEGSGDAHIIAIGKQLLDMIRTGKAINPNGEIIKPSHIRAALRRLIRPSGLTQEQIVKKAKRSHKIWALKRRKQESIQKRTEDMLLIMKNNPQFRGMDQLELYEKAREKAKQAFETEEEALAKELKDAEGALDSLMNAILGAKGLAILKVVTVAKKKHVMLKYRELIEELEASKEDIEGENTELEEETIKTALKYAGFPEVYAENIALNKEQIEKQLKRAHHGDLIPAGLFLIDSGVTTQLGIVKIGELLDLVEDIQKGTKTDEEKAKKLVERFDDKDKKPQGIFNDARILTLAATDPENLRIIIINLTPQQMADADNYTKDIVNKVQACQLKAEDFSAEQLQKTQAFIIDLVKTGAINFASLPDTERNSDKMSVANAARVQLVKNALEIYSRIYHEDMPEALRKLEITQEQVVNACIEPAGLAALIKELAGKALNQGDPEEELSDEDRNRLEKMQNEASLVEMAIEAAAGYVVSIGGSFYIAGVTDVVQVKFIIKKATELKERVPSLANKSEDEISDLIISYVINGKTTRESRRDLVKVYKKFIPDLTDDEAQRWLMADTSHLYWDKENTEFTIRLQGGEKETREERELCGYFNEVIQKEQMSDENGVRKSFQDFIKRNTDNTKETDPDRYQRFVRVVLRHDGDFGRSYTEGQGHKRFETNGQIAALDLNMLFIGTIVATREQNSQACQRLMAEILRHELTHEDLAGNIIQDMDEEARQRFGDFYMFVDLYANIDNEDLVGKLNNYFETVKPVFASGWYSSEEKGLLGEAFMEHRRTVAEELSKGTEETEARKAGLQAGCEYLYAYTYNDFTDKGKLNMQKIMADFKNQPATMNALLQEFGELQAMMGSREKDEKAKVNFAARVKDIRDQMWHPERFSDKTPIREKTQEEQCDEMLANALPGLNCRITIKAAPEVFNASATKVDDATEAATLADMLNKALGYFNDDPNIYSALAQNSAIKQLIGSGETDMEIQVHVVENGSGLYRDTSGALHLFIHKNYFDYIKQEMQGQENLAAYAYSVMLAYELNQPFDQQTGERTAIQSEEILESNPVVQGPVRSIVAATTEKFAGELGVTAAEAHRQFAGFFAKAKVAGSQVPPVVVIHNVYQAATALIPQEQEQAPESETPVPAQEPPAPAQEPPAPAQAPAAEAEVAAAAPEAPAAPAIAEPTPAEPAAKAAAPTTAATAEPTPVPAPAPAPEQEPAAPAETPPAARSKSMPEAVIPVVTSALFASKTPFETMPASFIEYIIHNPDVKRLYDAIPEDLGSRVEAADTPEGKLAAIHKEVHRINSEQRLGLDCEPLSVLIYTITQELGIEGVGLAKIKASPQNHIVITYTDTTTNTVMFLESTIPNAKFETEQDVIARLRAHEATDYVADEAIKWGMDNVIAEVMLREAVSAARVNNAEDMIEFMNRAIKLDPTRIKEYHMLRALVVRALPLMLLTDVESAALNANMVLGLDLDVVDNVFIQYLAEFLTKLPVDVQKNITIITHGDTARIEELSNNEHITITAEAPENEVKAAVIVCRSQELSPFKEVAAEHTRFIEVSEALEGQIILATDILFAIFQLPFKQFIQQFAAAIGLSESELEALYGDTGANTIAIRPVSKEKAEEIRRLRIIGTNV